jgi:hypothetical protein
LKPASDTMLGYSEKLNMGGVVFDVEATKRFVEDQMEFLQNTLSELVPIRDTIEQE